MSISGPNDNLMRVEMVATVKVEAEAEVHAEVGG
jgi:hypothetical protein